MPEPARRGRPPSADPRRNQTFRLLPSVLGALDSLAAARGTSPTRLLEDLIMSQTYTVCHPSVGIWQSGVSTLREAESSAHLCWLQTGVYPIVEDGAGNRYEHLTWDDYLDEGQPVRAIDLTEKAKADWRGAGHWEAPAVPPRRWVRKGQAPGVLIGETWKPAEIV